jgi:cytoskeletal protein CcmA (bactofilin family)
MEGSTKDAAKDWVRKTLGAQAPAAEPEPAAAPESPVATSSTFIDTGAEFEGTLRLTGTFRIDADFRGEIVSDGTVIIGEGAGVEATLRAREVVIAGAVVGDVQASRLLSIRGTGKLHGRVETPCLEVERGALFTGSTAMAHPETARRAARQAADAATDGGAGKPGATAATAAPAGKPGARAATAAR